MRAQLPPEITSLQINGFPATKTRLVEFILTTLNADQLSPLPLNLLRSSLKRHLRSNPARVILEILKANTTTESQLSWLTSLLGCLTEFRIAPLSHTLFLSFETLLGEIKLGRDPTTTALYRAFSADAQTESEKPATAAEPEVSSLSFKEQIDIFLSDRWIKSINIGLIPRIETLGLASIVAKLMTQDDPNIQELLFKWLSYLAGISQAVLQPRKITGAFKASLYLLEACIDHPERISDLPSMSILLFGYLREKSLIPSSSAAAASEAAALDLPIIVRSPPDPRRAPIAASFAAASALAPLQSPASPPSSSAAAAAHSQHTPESNVQNAPSREKRKRSPEAGNDEQQPAPKTARQSQGDNDGSDQQMANGSGPGLFPSPIAADLQTSSSSMQP